MDDLIKALITATGGDIWKLLVILFVAKDFWQQRIASRRAKGDAEQLIMLKVLAAGVSELCDSNKRQVARIDELVSLLNELRGRMR